MNKEKYGKVGDAFTIESEYLFPNEAFRTLTVTIALNLSEEGMCVIRLEDGSLFEVRYDVLGMVFYHVPSDKSQVSEYEL